MKILVAGACGFVGTTFIQGILDNQLLSGEALSIIGLDNLSRPEVEINEPILQKLGIDFRRADVSFTKVVGIFSPTITK